jgi:hypothetical protein
MHQNAFYDVQIALDVKKHVWHNMFRRASCGTLIEVTLARKIVG